VGFGAGYVMLELYVDFLTDSPKTLGLDSNDTRWLGAWWAGFLLWAVIMILLSLPFLAFPKTLPVTRSEEDDGDPTIDPAGSIADHIKGLLYLNINFICDSNVKR